MTKGEIVSRAGSFAAVLILMSSAMGASAADQPLVFDRPVTATLLLQLTSNAVETENTESELNADLEAGVSSVCIEIPVSIPEPSTLVLIISGFGILMGFQRLRRRH